MKSYLYGSAVVAACLVGAANSAEEAKEATPLIQMAYELMARASSTSEVLTLNLTNLAILIGLKILFFGFGIFGFAATQGGGGGNGGLFGGRSDDDSSTSIKQSELTGGMCFIMYTSGDHGKLTCVQRTACEDPKTATNYLTAAKMWHKMHKIMQVVPFNEKGYSPIMEAVEEATEHSLKGGDCSKYHW